MSTGMRMHGCVRKKEDAKAGVFSLEVPNLYAITGFAMMCCSIFQPSEIGVSLGLSGTS